MSGLLDGAARVLILVLSALATLAIIGSIAAIPSGEVARQFGMDSERAATMDQPEAAPAPPAEAGNVAAGVGASEGALVEAPPAPERPRAERWLEVIAYALIGVAGLLAVIALTLMRAVGYLRERARS